MNIKSIWMAGFHIGFNESNDWRDEILYDNWLKNRNDGLAMSEANSNAMLDIKELLQMISEIPCTCDKMYTDRGLCAPDCPRCNWIEDNIVNKVSERFNVA